MTHGRSKRKKKTAIKLKKQPLSLFHNREILEARQLNKLVDQINKLNGYGVRYERI